jgi:hypothetical protein
MQMCLKVTETNNIQYLRRGTQQRPTGSKEMTFPTESAFKATVSVEIRGYGQSGALEWEGKIQKDKRVWCVWGE